MPERISPIEVFDLGNFKLLLEELFALASKATRETTELEKDTLQ